MNEMSPSRLYAVVFGAVLVVAGILGFFVSSDFSTGDDVPREGLLGLFDVNGWHNVVHIATGALGLAAAASLAAARLYALGLGVVYVAVAVWGLAIGGGEVIAGLIPVNTADNMLHLAIGVVGLAAGLATGGTGAPARQATA